MKLFLQKNAKFSSASRPPCLRRLGALPPDPQNSPPIANFWLRACTNPKLLYSCEDAIRRVYDFQIEQSGKVDKLYSYTNQMICARGNVSNVVDACEGDEGGPLIREVLKSYA